ncbi:unnamed protein product [Rotaria socialis]|uniref:Nuclear receptor domain-containing protein n=1 Tax=Rotaria socialis TaxID=392032 RepID=A0A818CH52_9BILA|nr:unnamed protein product [Rotaria socialis]CAF3427144.1 unnamed protein product [Rotaria socialis]CAF3430202.1 unnamed protein product [Rotaria socialis]CAF3671898.1 unnamed protein product [Rotaria socialis]CAF4231589.1 unnamed protein product [Rotaria socialis]
MIEEIVDEVPTSAISSQSTTAVRKLERILSNCRICGDSAVHINYGVISCASCKMFFYRNINGEQRETLKCDFNDNCEITIYNRHICSFCRLEKCFAMGMQKELIRGSRSTKNRKRDRPTTTRLLLVRQDKKEQSQQFSTLNLLQSDVSTLNVDQWNLLSNLIHCYDEHSGLPYAQHFINEQNSLPLKCRFKCAAIGEFIRQILHEGQLIYEKNGDFLSLCSQDRSTLIHTTVKHMSCFGGTFILYQAQLMDYPSFFQSGIILFGLPAMVTAKFLSDLFDSDMTFIKLALSILAFSTINYVVYENTASVNMKNLIEIIRIQDTYTDLSWRYLLYKYGHTEAVLRFSNLIRCILNANSAIIQAATLKEFPAIIDYVVKRTESILVFDD